MMSDGLILRDNAKAELMQIKSIEEGVSYLNKLESVAIWVMKEKKDAELSNLVAEQKLRTQRILGELLQQSDKGQGMRTDLVPTGNEVKQKETLTDIGLSRKQSSAFQQIASIPEETFEQFIEEKKAAVNNAVAELTTTGAVRLAKSLKEKQKDLDTLTDINNQLDMERELRDLAAELRKKYDSDQIDLLIKFLTK
jgi:hypothetical protein